MLWFIGAIASAHRGGGPIRGAASGMTLTGSASTVSALLGELPTSYMFELL